MWLFAREKTEELAPFWQDQAHVLESVGVLCSVCIAGESIRMQTKMQNNWLGIVHFTHHFLFKLYAG